MSDDDSDFFVDDDTSPKKTPTPKENKAKTKKGRRLICRINV